MADLKTDYKDDVLDTTQNTKRKYQMIDNGDGTVSFEDVTEYLQQGDSFGADDTNATNTKVNALETDIDETNTKVNALETDIDETNTKVNALETDIGEINDNLIDVMNDLQNRDKVYMKCYLSGSAHKITGSATNQMYLCFGLSGLTDTQTYLSVLFKQSNKSSTGYIRNFGGSWYSNITYSANSYDITFTNSNTSTTLIILSLQPFTIS